MPETQRGGGHGGSPIRSFRLRTVESETKGRRPRAPQGDGAKLRDELIDAATKLISKRGDSAAVTLRAVAREVGITAPSIYLHFADRNALLKAVLVEEFARFEAVLRVAVAGAAGAEAQLRAGCRAYVDYGAEFPGSYAVLFAGLHPAIVFDADDEVGLDAFDILVAGVAKAMAAGATPEGDKFAVARKLWVGLHGQVTLRATFDAFPWDSLDDALDELLHDVAQLPVHHAQLPLRRVPSTSNSP